MLKRKGSLVEPKESLIYMLKGGELLTNSEKVATITTYQNQLILQLKDQTTGYIDVNKLSDVNSIALHHIKDFNIRTEMMERQNEWVGAFKDHSGYWHKVGFLTSRMVAKETAILSRDEIPLDHHDPCSPYEIDRCIPIEDIPKEDLQ